MNAINGFYASHKWIFELPLCGCDISVSKFNVVKIGLPLALF